MTPTLASGSIIFQGIYLLFVVTSLVKSQTTLSLDSTRRDSTSGNSTILHKVSQEGNYVISAALKNNGERKETFISTTTKQSEKFDVNEQLDVDIPTTKQSQANEEKYLSKSQGINQPTKYEKIQIQPDIETNNKHQEFALKHSIFTPNSPLEEKKPIGDLEFDEKDEGVDLDESNKFGIREPTTTKRNDDSGMISLMNDTDVNYRGAKKEPENVTNVISKDPDVHEKLKDPKKQFEFVKNPTLVKNMEALETQELGGFINKAIGEKSLKVGAEFPKAEDKIADNNETLSKKRIVEVENIKERSEHGNHSPKSLTLSLSGINQLSSTEEKVIDSTKEQVELGFTKDVKPYPYFKTSTSNPISRKNNESKEEISAQENIIGKSQDPNGVSQVKSVNPKRNSGATRNIPNNSQSTVTQKLDLPAEQLNTMSTLSVVLKNTANEISGNPEELTEKSGTSNLVGISGENITTTNSTESERNIEENGEMKNTNSGVQSDIENSMLKESPLKVITEATTKLTTSTPEIDFTKTTVIPEILTITSSPEFTTLAMTSDDVESTTIIPEVIPTTLGLSTSTESSNFSQLGLDKSEATTSGVQYVFVELTETSVPQTHSTSSESSGKSLTDDNNNNNININNKKNDNSTSLSTSSSENTTTDSTESSIIHESTTQINIDSMTTSMKSDESTMLTMTTEELLPTTDEISFETTTVNTIIYPDETTTIIIEKTTINDELMNNKSKEQIVDFSDLPNASTTLANFDFDIATNDSDPVTPTMSISTMMPDVLSTEPKTNTPTESVTVTNIEITTRTETDIQPLNPEDVTVLVRIIVDGTWADVCPQLSALKQSLADLLTVSMKKVISRNQIIFRTNPCIDEMSNSVKSDIWPNLFLYVVDKTGNFNAGMTRILPTLYSQSPIKSQLTIRNFQLVQDSDSGNAIAVIIVSCVAFICLVLLAGLLFIMRKRQTRFNYGERCRPVSLDAYSLDSVSAYNSVRRKGATRSSKRSYGNPTFEDSTAIPSHPLNFGGLSTFCNEQNTIAEEFSSIPQVSAKIDEIPPGAEVKNRYANVVPLPETRVPLSKINNDPLSEYINASYVRGPKNATKYYIACQGPIESTVTDFWRMVWEQQTKVIIMLTDLIENGVEKCAEYIPPSEVTDCHRLFGDFQVTLKKRETKEKYAISTLLLKNLENSTYREISHIWYLWPANGVQTDSAGLIAVLLEARALQRGGPGPIVVHCSPGTGRTGTLIALDLGIRQYEITRTVDVPRVVYTIRRDRAGAVKTKEQYAFIYKALNLYATKLAGGGLEST